MIFVPAPRYDRPIGFYYRPSANSLLFVDGDEEDRLVPVETPGGDNIAMIRHALRRAGLRSDARSPRVRLLLDNREHPLPVGEGVAERDAWPEANVLAWWLGRAGFADKAAAMADSRHSTDAEADRFRAAFAVMTDTMRVEQGVADADAEVWESDLVGQLEATRHERLKAEGLETRDTD